MITMVKARKLLIPLAFTCIFLIWGCATTPPVTVPYNPIFKCSFKEAWNAVLISLDECGVSLMEVDRENGWVAGVFKEWDKGTYAEYWIGVVINEVVQGECRLFVTGSYKADRSPVIGLVAEKYLKKRILKVQEAISRNLKASM